MKQILIYIISIFLFIGCKKWKISHYILKISSCKMQKKL